MGHLKKMKNKTLISIFIVIYLGQFFFCIFFRIESWPFSDYRVYPFHNHPKHIKAYIPYFKLSDGSYIPPILNNKFVYYIEKSYFQKAYLKYNPVDYKRYISALLKSNSMKKALKRMKKSNLIPTQFVIMEIKFTEKKKHKWEPIFTPVKEYDIL